jgi:hypothetical protein
MTFSDAYTNDQVVYEWKKGADKSIETANDMRLSQFTLVRIPASSLVVKNGSGRLNNISICIHNLLYNFR